MIFLIYSNHQIDVSKVPSVGYKPYLTDFVNVFVCWSWQVQLLLVALAVDDMSSIHLKDRRNLSLVGFRLDHYILNLLCWKIRKEHTLLLFFFRLPSTVYFVSTYFSLSVQIFGNRIEFSL